MRGVGIWEGAWGALQKGEFGDVMGRLCVALRVTAPALQLGIDAVERGSGRGWGSFAKGDYCGMWR